MAGPYYVNIGSPGAWNGKTGLDSGANCWLGISGLQKAFDTVAANEICYVKGTGDLSKFYVVTYDASSGTTLTDGEEVTWDSGEGAWVDGTDKGIVRIATSTAGGAGTVELELTTGALPADNDVIKGTTSTQTITRAATANAAKSMDIDTQTGAFNTGMIRFIGTNSTFVVDGTRAVVNAATAVVNCFTFTATSDGYWFENMEAENAGAAKDGWNSPNSSWGHVFINCSAHNCGGDGFDIGQYYGYFFRCTAYSNTGNGFKYNSAARLYFCSSYTNTTHGFYSIAGGNDTIGCIAHANTDDGYELYQGDVVMNCVADANTDDGIIVVTNNTVAPVIIIGNRITNHSGAGDIGLNCNSKVMLTGWNYFENNADANIQNATLHYFIPLEGTATTSNEEDQADTDYGYVDSAGHDFSTDYTDATDPTLRRKAITIPWT